MAILTIDHLAVAATSLEAGAAWVEAALGVPLSPGGQHPAMGTYNRLLNLGASEYLEVIAIDPAAAVPGRARWFDLDDFAGPPRLTAWVARCDDLEAALNALPGSGAALALSRGDLRWEMAVPKDGRLPFDGAAPALIRWEGSAHPAACLPDHGCRLAALEITHPQPSRLQTALAPLIDDPRLSIEYGACVALRATISTPNGDRILA